MTLSQGGLAAVWDTANMEPSMPPSASPLRVCKQEPAPLLQLHPGKQPSRTRPPFFIHAPPSPLLKTGGQSYMQVLGCDHIPALLLHLRCALAFPTAVLQQQHWLIPPPLSHPGLSPQHMPTQSVGSLSRAQARSSPQSQSCVTRALLQPKNQAYCWGWKE